MPVKTIIQRNYYTVIFTEDERIFVSGSFDAFEDTKEHMEQYKGALPNSRIKDIKAGKENIGILTEDNKLYFIGSNYKKHLDDTNKMKKEFFHKVRPNEEQEKVSAFDVGRDYHIYTTDTGKAYISGDYFIDNTGDGRPNSDYLEMKFTEGVVPIQPYCSNNYRSNSVAIMLVKNKEKMELWSCGRSRDGLLGQGKGNTETRDFKPMTYDKENIQFVRADFKYNFGYALTDKGELYSWGDNDYSK